MHKIEFPLTIQLWNRWTSERNPEIIPAVIPFPVRNAPLRYYAFVSFMIFRSCNKWLQIVCALFKRIAHFFFFFILVCHRLFYFVLFLFSRYAIVSFAFPIFKKVCCALIRRNFYFLFVFVDPICFMHLFELYCLRWNWKKNVHDSYSFMVEKWPAGEKQAHWQIQRKRRIIPIISNKNEYLALDLVINWCVVCFNNIWLEAACCH